MKAYITKESDSVFIYLNPIKHIYLNFSHHKFSAVVQVGTELHVQHMNEIPMEKVFQKLAPKYHVVVNKLIEIETND